MATPKKDLEIFLESITLDKAVFKGKAKRVADFKLVYPRLTLAQKTSSKTLTLDGATVVKPAFKSWTDRILFKEPVQGTFGIEFSLSDKLSEKELENAVSSTGATLLRLLGDAFADSIGVKGLNGFMELPLDGLAKVLSGKTYSAKTAAQGVIDIEGSDYSSLKSGEEKTLTFPIVSTRDIVDEKHRSTKSQSDRVVRKTTLKADATLGTVTLKIKAI